MLQAENDSEHKNCTECGKAYGFVDCRYTILGKGEPIHICLSCARNKDEIISRRKQKPPEGQLFSL